MKEEGFGELGHEETMAVFSSLSLTSVTVGKFLVVMKSDFDLTISEEPYIGLVMLLNQKTGRYFSRIWNETVATGNIVGPGQLLEVCEEHFSQGRPCLGCPDEDEEKLCRKDFLVSQTPIPRKIAKTCHKVLGKDAHASVSSCSECAKLMGSCVNERKDVDKHVVAPDYSWKMKGNQADVPLASPKLEFVEDSEMEEVDDFVTQSEFPNDGDFHVDPEVEIKIEDEEEESESLAKKGEMKKCQFCEAHFKRQGIYFHLIHVHFWGKFRCPECPAKVPFAKDLYNHVTQKHNLKDAQVLCPRCKGKIPVEEIVSHYEPCVKEKHNSHRRTSKKDDPDEPKIFQCPKCQQILKTKRNLNKHMTSHHMWGDFSCLQCGVKLEYANDLLDHMREKNHILDASVICPLCQDKIPMNEIESHYKRCFYKDDAKRRQENIVCTLCGKLVRKYIFHRHQRVHMRRDGISEAEAKTKLYYYCDVCGKKLNSRSNLDLHKKNVHNPTPAACPVCGIVFPNKPKMKRHYHKEHDPKQCELCDYKAVNNATLKDHMAKHSDPQFQCSYCEKKLKSKKSLEAHERDHTGERPFKCEVCGKGFKSSTVLIVHKQGVHKIFGPKAIQDPVKRIRKRKY